MKKEDTVYWHGHYVNIFLFSFSIYIGLITSPSDMITDFVSQ